MGIADLFRPKYRHSKVEVRAEAVRQLTSDEADVLLGIARKDPDASIRRIAVEKIEQPDVLVDLAEREHERSVRDLARGRAAKIWVGRANSADDAGDANEAIKGLVALGDQRAIAEIASRANLVDVRDVALSHLDDAKALAELARNSNTHVAARATAIARIDDIEVLGKIAVDEKRKDVAMLAFDRIDDPVTLEVLASKAKNKVVRTRARRRVSELNKPAPSSGSSGESPAEGKPQVSPEEKRRHAERVQHVRTAEKLSRADDVGTAATEMERIKVEYAALGDNPDEKQHASFERSCLRFDNRYAAYQARHQERLAAEARENRAKAPPPQVEPDAGDTAEQPTAAQPPDGDGTAADADEPAVDTDEPAVDTDEPAVDGITDTAGDDAEAAKRREEREQKKRERRQEALTALTEVIEELKAGVKLENRKAADTLLKKADKQLHATHLGEDDAELRESFKTARHALVLRVHELRDDAGWQQWANISQQETLIAKAKTMLASDDKSNLSKRLRDLQAEWKAVGPAPRKKGQELWETFKALCDQIYEGVKVQRAAQSEVQAVNFTRKLELCDRVEALSDSTDWEETANQIKDLQRQWKAIGPVPRKKSDAVWKRFRGACDLFFERRKPFMAEQLAQQEKNLETKQAMCEQAETLAESTDWKETTTKLRQLQKNWRDAGLVQRKDANAINKRFRNACDLFFERRKEFQDEQRRERERQIGDLKAEIKAIAELEASGSEIPGLSDADDAAVATEDKVATDDGVVTDDGVATGDAAGDADDGGGDADQEMADAASVEKLVARTLAVRAKLRELMPEGKTKHILYKQANDLFRTMIEWHGDQFGGTELDPAASSQKKHKLLAKAEEIAPPPADDSSQVNDGDETAEQMAERLRAALAQNALSSALANSTDGRNMADTIADLQEAWLVIGPVPGAEGMELEDRFETACERGLRSAGVQR